MVSALVSIKSENIQNQVLPNMMSTLQNLCLFFDLSKGKIGEVGGNDTLPTQVFHVFDICEAISLWDHFTYFSVNVAWEHPLWSTRFSQLNTKKPVMVFRSSSSPQGGLFK